MKKLIYHLWILLFLLGCEKAVNVDYSSLHVDFLRSSVDVGENTSLLELPVMLTGIRDDLPLQVTVTIEAIDGTAVMGTDYELLDKTLTFERCGQSLLRVKMLDNKDLSQEGKEFSLRLKVETPQVQSEVSTVQVNILSDDMPPFEFEGRYTLTAHDYKTGEAMTTEPGSVQIIQDPQHQNRYLLRDIILTKGDKVFPLSWADTDLYIEQTEQGILQMPVRQDIGDHGNGDAFTITITPDGYAEETPIRIRVSSGKRLVFVRDALGGVSMNAAGKPVFHYVLKDIVLEKVNP